MNKPLKIGLIGAGRMGNAHLPAYLQYPDQVKLTAVCDIDQNAVTKFAAQAGISNVFLDIEKMLKNADIEAVDICTPHDVHFDQVLAAAKAGKHILLEKAMSRTIAECRRMVSATDHAGVKYMVAQDLRYLPYMQAVKRLVDEGELGQIRAARCDSIMNTMQACPPGHWMLDAERAGGGVLITLTIHMIDLLRYYIGNVKKVTGVCKSVWSGLKDGAEDYACATLEFENGAIGTAFSIWTVSRSPTAIQYMLYGEKGAVYTGLPTIETRGQQVGPAMVASPKRNEAGTQPTNILSGFVPVTPMREGLAGDNPFVNEILHFARCCQEDQEPIE